VDYGGKADDDLLVCIVIGSLYGFDFVRLAGFSAVEYWSSHRLAIVKCLQTHNFNTTANYRSR
jgi:hypothetical protein